MRLPRKSSPASTPTSRREARARSVALKDEDVPGLADVSERTIYPHVFANADREVGGVLVGRVSKGGGRPLVTGAIEALAADEQRATLTFTQDAWEHVHRTLDRDYSEDDQIVGWYHSHPNFGIFLSEHDLFIHRNFFSGVSQIAVVVDPCGATEGTFVWRDGKVDVLYERPTPPRWLPQNDGRDRPPYVITEGPPPPPAAGARRYPVVPLVVAAVAGLAIGFGVWSAVDSGDTKPAPDASSKPPSAKTDAVTAPAPTAPAQTSEQLAPVTPVPPTPTVPTKPSATTPTPGRAAPDQTDGTP